MANNLRPYQYQIGDLVFGPGTPYRVLGVTFQSYNVNSQDFQVPTSDETRMGIDTEQAGPITFKIGVIDNAPMPYIAGGLPSDLVAKSSKLLTALQTEWKADDVRKLWGELKPIVYCDGYGSTRRIYGRPRKFSYTRKTKTSQYYTVTAEFARADSLTYTDTEYVTDNVAAGAAAVPYTRLGGDANSWIRVLYTGPMTNPTVIIGPFTIQLQTAILAGVTVELSTYPWARRIIDSAGGNRRAALIGDSKYLDQIAIPPDTSLPISLTATGTTADSRCFVLWRDAYNTV